MKEFVEKTKDTTFFESKVSLLVFVFATIVSIIYVIVNH